MEEKQPSLIDLLVETHIDLERQGPGSTETTLKALGFLDHPERMANAADLGCGSGPQTLELARHLPGTIVGLDMFPAFIDKLNQNAQRQGVADRVKGIVGSMDNLPFEKQSLDLIWSEGAIDNIGFENGLAHWRAFLKRDGYVATTCPSWLTSEHPAAVEAFWLNAGSRLDSIERNIEAMQRCGYQFVAAFALPKNCWTDHYFIPREAALRKILERHAGSDAAKAFAAENRHEVELYSKYHEAYGYVFYIGRKL